MDGSALSPEPTPSLFPAANLLLLRAMQLLCGGAAQAVGERTKQMGELSVAVPLHEARQF